MFAAVLIYFVLLLSHINDLRQGTIEENCANISCVRKDKDQSREMTS